MEDKFDALTLTTRRDRENARVASSCEQKMTRSTSLGRGVGVCSSVEILRKKECKGQFFLIW
jgi:hypothetical protein